MHYTATHALCLIIFVRSFVIYRDPLVTEARRARGVLTRLKERVDEVLVELPDYPLLKQVCIITKYILSFLAASCMIFNYNRYCLLLIKSSPWTFSVP